MNDDFDNRVQYNNDKREILIKLGFVPQGPQDRLYATDPSGLYVIDFSAINPTYYLQHALDTVYKQGKACGEYTIKESLKKLIGVEIL